jgi:hypothetical protein
MAKQNPKQKTEKVAIESPTIEKEYNKWVVLGSLTALIFVAYGRI